MSENRNDTSTMRVTHSLAMSSSSSGGAVCIKGHHIGRMIPLPADKPVLFGRDAAACQYAVNDIQVSRRHCTITYIATLNQYRIVDTSSNGTFLGTGERLVKYKEYYLPPATEIYLGNGDNLYKLR